METHLQQPSHPPKKKWPKSHPNPSGLLLILKGLSHHEIRPSSDATPKFLPQHAWNAVAQSREARIFLFKDTVHLCRNWWEALGTFILGMTKLHCSSHFCLCKLPGQDTSIGRPLDHLHFFASWLSGALHGFTQLRVVYSSTSCRPSFPEANQL